MTDEDDKFNQAFDEREAARIGSDLDLAFIRAGGKLTASEAEAARVKAMLKRDRADASKERDRKAAELQVRDGVFVNLADTVIEPTPEWLRQGDVVAFTPKQPDGTVRKVSTVRRVVTPLIIRMWNAGKITDEQCAAALWYRATYEVAALEGRYSTSQWSATGSVQRSAKIIGFVGHVAMHQTEAEARDAFRTARNALPAFYLRFFEAVVLHDVPLRRAGRFARCPERKINHRFRMVIQQLADHCEQSGVECVRDNKSHAG